MFDFKYASFYKFYVRNLLSFAVINKSLKRSICIRLLSGSMLCIFAFSITPKLFLHSIFAGHVDNKTVRTGNSPYQISKGGFNCDQDGLAVTAPFIADESFITVQTFILFSPHLWGDISFTSSERIYASLRGPPTVSSYCTV